MSDFTQEQDASEIHIGFLGLGRMGAPMAANLLRAGYQVHVWNRSAHRIDALVAEGAVPAASPAELAAGPLQMLCLCVTNHRDVEEVLFGSQGAMNGARPGLIVVDHSTLSPAAARSIARRVEGCQARYLDAPVSGGDTGAQAGTLSIMVGGDQATFEEVQPLLLAMGRSIRYLGPSGAGQACKACNQIAVMGALLGAGEALALARRSGLDLKTVVEVISSGAGGSWQLANLGPKMAIGDHAPGFKVQDALKDLAIVAETAQSLDLPVVVSTLAENLLRSLAAAGEGQKGTQALSLVLERLGGFSFVASDEDQASN